MSQSRFSIVLVGVSALLRRPLVSRLRSADGERSPWVVFAARGDLPFRRLPLGELAFGLSASAFRHAPLRSCRSAGWPSGSRLPLFGTHHFGVAARRVGSSAFRFGVALGELVFLPSVSELPSASWFFCLPFRRWPLGELAFGLTVSASRHAPLRGCPQRVGSSTFRFGDCCSAS